MQILLELKDDQYPFQGIDIVRHCARAVVFDKNGKVGITHLLVEKDTFGGRNYYELPGGGVQTGENPREAAIREMSEELGVNASVIAELGVVHDYYNLIKTENYSHYFIMKVEGYTHQQLEESEKKLIDRIEWKDLDELIDIFENYQLPGVGLLVKRRELPILKLAKAYVDKHGKVL